MRSWIKDSNPKVRRAVTEGLRVWTSRPHFRDHPDIAIQLLSQLKDDEGGYVRKSVGNTLRDISRKHRELTRAELQQWDISKNIVQETYRLASKFLLYRKNPWGQRLKKVVLEI
jgi:3-methyladenine DNA glycosylase AlkC